MTTSLNSNFYLSLKHQQLNAYPQIGLKAKLLINGKLIGKTTSDNYGKGFIYIAPQNISPTLNCEIRITDKRTFKKEGFSTFQSEKVEVFFKHWITTPEELFANTYTFTINENDLRPDLPVQIVPGESRRDINRWSFGELAHELEAAIMPQIDNVEVKAAEFLEGEISGADLMSYYGIDSKKCSQLNPDTALELLRNGICQLPCKSVQNQNPDTEYCFELNWESYPYLPNDGTLTDFQFYTKKDPTTKKMVPNYFNIRFQHEAWQTFTCDTNNPSYNEHAMKTHLYYLISTALVFGAGTLHLGKGHFIPGVAAIAKSFLKTHPLGRILDLMLQGVPPINAAALEKVADDVLAKSDLGSNGVLDMVRKNFKMPLTQETFYQPTPPLSDEFYVDKARQTYYLEVVTPYVEQLFQEYFNINEDKITDLTGAYCQLLIFYDYMLESTTKQVVTKNWYEEKPTLEKVNMLKEVVKQIVLHSVFEHSLQHNAQPIGLLNLNIGSIEPRSRNPEELPYDMTLAQLEGTIAQMPLVKQLVEYQFGRLCDEPFDLRFNALHQSWIASLEEKNPLFLNLVNELGGTDKFFLRAPMV